MMHEGYQTIEELAAKAIMEAEALGDPMLVYLIGMVLHEIDHRRSARQALRAIIDDYMRDVA